MANTYIDASTATSVAQGVALNRASVANPTSTSRADRFWSSRRASITDQTSEVFEIDLATSGLVNRVSFDSVRFPQIIEVQYTTDNGQNWLPVRDNITGQAITLVVFDSFPAVLPSPTVVAGHHHPQHDYDGHWQSHSFQVAPVAMQKLRWVITRNQSGNSPVDATGAGVPYSVALQNVEIGYVVSSEDDIPRALLEGDSKQTTETFADSSDLFDSNFGFAKRTRFADGLLNNTDESAPFVWQSEPQPFPDAVVNFYADMRDLTGKPQIVDRIFIDPLYEGPAINLYYSNQTDVTEFKSSRKSLSNLEAGIVNGTIDQAAGLMRLGTFVDPSALTIQVQAGMFASGDGGTPIAPDGITVAFVPSYTQINNSAVSFQPHQDWWMGMSFLPTGDLWRANFDSVSHPLFSCDQFEIGYVTSNAASQDQTVSGASGDTVGPVTAYIYLRTAQGDQNLVPIYLDGAEPHDSTIGIVVASYDDTLHVSTNHHGQTTTIDIPQSVPFDPELPSSLFLGTDTKITRFSNPAIESFILKQETWTDDDFFTSPLLYSRVALFTNQPELGGDNALIRFDPSLISDSAPTGLVGGPAFSFENLTWTPIPRTYAMHRGSLILPATKARFWNLEITNLRPAVNDKYIPVTRKIKTYPADVIAAFNSSKTNSSRQSYDDLPTNVQSSLAGVIAYSDIPTYTGTGVDTSSFSNTEVYVATDENTAQRLANLGSEWRYRKWHADSDAPRFTTTRVHNYNEQEVQQTSNVSFYCGLRNIQFQRITRTVAQDWPIIEEDFLDATGIDTQGNFLLDDEIASYNSGDSNYAQGGSITVSTQRGVRALQFAAQQSDPKQINIYGDFSGSSGNLDVTAWTPYGSSKILGLVDVNSATDKALLISRKQQIGFWADLQWYPEDAVFTDFGTGSYGAITKYNPSQYPDTVAVPGYSNSFGNLTAGIQGQGSGHYTADGGVISSSVEIPFGGRVYAAARVTATQTLTQPLYLQILDSTTGQVLSESQTNVTRNKIQEWYTGMDTSVFGQKVGLRWGDLTKPPTYPSFSDNFERDDSIVLGAMNPSGQLWSTPGTSLTISNNQALCTAPGQRSEFDTLTPWGTLKVTLGNLTTQGGVQYVPLIDLGGIYLCTDGALYGTSSIEQIGNTLSLAAGHTYSFTFLSSLGPVQFPSGVSSLDPFLFPFAIEIRDNGTLVQTVQLTRPISSLRAIMGLVNQTFSDVSWVPGTGDTSGFANEMLSAPIPNIVDLQRTESGNATYLWKEAIPGFSASEPIRYRNWMFQGSYTYSTFNDMATEASSLAPADTFLSPPSNLTVVTASPSLSNVPTSTPTFSAYATMFDVPSEIFYWRVTATNSVGETIGSNEIGATVQLGGTATLTWDAVPYATGYNVYRGPSSGNELLLARVGNNTKYVDTFQIDNTGATALPTTNTSNENGTVAVAQMMDEYGTMAFYVEQMTTVTAVPIAYLNYNLDSGKILSLYGDGSIYDENQNLLASIPVFDPTAGEVQVRYLPAQILSDSLKTTWNVAPNDTQAIVILQNETVQTVLRGTDVWDSTWRGIGGGYQSDTDYTIIDGPVWYPEGATKIPNMDYVFWYFRTAGSTATYGSLSQSVPPSVEFLQVRLVQKVPSEDSWLVQSVALFWDPITWDFSCDDGVTWWPAIDIRNNPNAVLQFPPGLSEYGKLKWRVYSYSPDMHISHVAIRPWYAGAIGYGEVPRPTQLPLGPNLVPTEFFSRIENDPRWQSWSSPIPRWWWNG